MYEINIIIIKQLKSNSGYHVGTLALQWTWMDNKDRNTSRKQLTEAEIDTLVEQFNQIETHIATVTNILHKKETPHEDKTEEN